MSADNKTVTFSHDAWITTTSAVLTVMRDLRRTIGGSPVAPEFMDYLLREVAVNTEAMAAMNAPAAREDTHGALEGDMLKTVIAALNFAMHTRNLAGELPLHHAIEGMNIRRISFVDMEAALIFLENPK